MSRANETNPDYYYLSEAAELSELSPAMVDYLCRTRILAPSQNTRRKRGVKRMYSFGDVVMLRVISSLLASGLSVSGLAKGLRQLRKRHPEITATSLPAKFLASDGKSLFFLNPRASIEDLTQDGQMVFAFVVGMEAVRDSVTIAKTRLR